MAERPCARDQCEPDGGATIWYHHHTTLAFARISV